MENETQLGPGTRARPLGIVAFSFANRGPEGEPNPCNQRLAEAVRRSANCDTVIVAQWEVARALASVGVPVDHVVEQADEGSYLDSETVWAAASRIFHSRHVLDVFPVAQPFLQYPKVKLLIRNDGFRLSSRKVGWVGFDRSNRNRQWWTRGPIRLMVYSVLQAAVGLRGPRRGAPTASR